MTLQSSLQIAIAITDGGNSKLVLPVTAAVAVGVS